MNTTKQGKLGEDQATEFLTRRGYKIIARNYRAVGGEIDLVAYRQKTLVFVEVKWRASNAFGGPIAAVTATKQRRIVQAALQFVKAKIFPNYENIRFDVICILPDRLEHIENAFYPLRTTL